MGKIENPSISEMKAIIECEENGLRMDDEYNIFNFSEIEELCCYFFDECMNGLSDETRTVLTDEFGNATGVETDILHQARIIAYEIDNLKIYQQAMLLIAICEKHGLKELKFIER